MSREEGKRNIFFLPFFGERVDGALKEVSLLGLFEIAPYLRAAYFIAVIGIVIWGVVTLALQNCRCVLWLKAKSKVSLALNAVGALLFIAGLQPYAAVFLFVFLAIKALMLIKWQ